MRRSLQLVYVFINVACVAAFLYSGHRVTSLMVAEERTESDGVDAITFVATAGPALAIALLGNAAWGLKAVVDLWRNRDRRAFLLLGIAVLLWLITIFGARHVWEVTARL